MKNFPAIKLSIFFAVGILLGRLFLVNIPIFIVLVILAVFSFLFYGKYPKDILHLFTNILVYTCIIFFGNLVSQLNEPHYNLLPESIYRVNNVKVIGKISNIELARHSEIVFNVETQSTGISDTILDNPLNFICRIKGNKKQLDSLYDRIAIGNTIHFQGNFYKGNEERNPGEFDYNKYLRTRGISGLLTAYDVSSLKIINDDKNILSTIVFIARKNIERQIEVLYDMQSAALLRGLLLADRSLISYDTKTEFINSGILHILAVSGLHVGFIILIFLFLFGRFNIYLRSILTIVGLIIYLILIGPPPSAFRAGIMAIVLIAAIITNRSTNLFNSIAIAGFIILFIHPEELFTAGFQLSFSAVISIAIIYSPIRKWLNISQISSGSIKNVIMFIAFSLAVQIGTLPFTIHYFGKVSLVALITNLLVIPLVGIIIGIGILSIAIALMSIAIAGYLSLVNNLIINFTYYLVHLIGSGSQSYLRISSFSVYDIVLFYTFLSIALVFYRKFNNYVARIILLILCVINFLLLSHFDNKELMPDNKLSVMMIDVGQGDSFLLKFPNGKTALIDAGVATYSNDTGERVILPLINYLGINKIDYGFVSHIDLDHYGGFISLIHYGKISGIYKPVIDSSESNDVRFEKYLAANKLTGNYYRKRIIKIGNARIYVLNFFDYNSSDSNNRSGLLKVVYGNSEFLFTGDLNKQGEEHYSKIYRGFLDSDVLKVGHHGSKTSSSKGFLKFVTPEVSLISDGRQNRYYHPAPQTLDNLKDINSKVYRTDISGAVLIQTDGSNIKNINWKGM
jgi:competence protein ComEC